MHMDRVIFLAIVLHYVSIDAIYAGDIHRSESISVAFNFDGKMYVRHTERHYKVDICYWKGDKRGETRIKVLLCHKCTC